MKVEDYQWQSDFAIKHRSEGRTEEAVKMILLILQDRKIWVPSEARERITGCDNLEQLERWVVRAATIDRVDQLFD